MTLDALHYASPVDSLLSRLDVIEINVGWQAVRIDLDCARGERIVGGVRSVIDPTVSAVPLTIA